MTFINIPSNAAEQWKAPVATSGELPATANLGDLRLALDTEIIYYWDGATWQPTAGGGGGGITSMNGLSTASQTFAVGSSGSDFNISSAGSTHTFNIPDASASARGVVTTGAQTFAGVKTFSDGVAGVDEYKVESFTLGGGDITAKQVTLSEAPTTASDTQVFVIGGPIQEYTTDFTVSGTTLDWDGLGLESLLESGDKIIVLYN